MHSLITIIESNQNPEQETFYENQPASEHGQPPRKRFRLLTTPLLAVPSPEENLDGMLCLYSLDGL